MSPATRNRLAVFAVLLAFGLIIIAGGVALALAQGMHLAAALISTPLALAAFVLLLRTDTELLIRALRGLQLLLPITAFGLTTLLMGKTAGTMSSMKSARR